MRRAFTILEVLIVVLIVSLLAGIMFVVSAPARESSRQSSCINNLKQLYVAVTLYSGDNGDGSVNGLDGLAFIPGGATKALSPYIKDKQIIYCPDSTQRMRDRFASTYAYSIMQNFVDIPIRPSTLAFLKQYKEMGTSTPIISCGVHDEMFYAPRESTINPVFAKPFMIHLLMNGSVKKGRFDEPRMKLFTN